MPAATDFSHKRNESGPRKPTAILTRELVIMPLQGSQARLRCAGFAKIPVGTKRRDHANIVGGGRPRIRCVFDDIETRVGPHRGVALFRSNMVTCS